VEAHRERRRRNINYCAINTLMEPLLPNFLIAGVQKGGTCAASINLSLHPNIKVARKEVHFFDGHWQQGVEWYHQKMHEIHKPHALLGDRTPAYFTDPRMHPRMMSVVPNAKIIILLRNPATRFISQWLMHKRQNAQHKRQNAQRQRDNTLESIIDRNCSDLFHRGLYFKHLRSLYKYFPKEQIHIAISERVKSNREKEYAKMFHFLGVDRRMDA